MHVLGILLLPGVTASGHSTGQSFCQQYVMHWKSLLQPQGAKLLYTAQLRVSTLAVLAGAGLLRVTDAVKIEKQRNEERHVAFVPASVIHGKRSMQTQ